MRHFTLSARRIRTVVGSGAIGAIAALAFAVPASATQASASESLMEARHSEKCNAQQRVEITWGLRLTELGAEQLDQAEFAIELNPQPGEGEWVDITGDDEIDSGAWNEARQILPAGTTKATLRVTVEAGKGGEARELINLTVDVSSVCATPSATATPSTSSSSSALLPVTGTSTAMIAGVAVALVVVGAGAFLAARRRRVRFTA